MKMKKLVAITIALGLSVSSLSATAFAQETTDSSEFVDCTGPQITNFKSIPELPNAEPNWEDSSVISRASSIKVNIQTPLETSWRNNYTDYYYQANRVIERIDDYLADKFGIDFYTVSQPNWSVSDKSTSSNVLNDAINNCGKGSADIMIAFAGAIVDTSNNVRFGIARVGGPYAVVYDHGYTQNCKSAQHETGHTYGLDHCSNTCVMQQGWDTNWTFFEHLCPQHKTKWDNAKNNY
ncbi:MAG: hypothetical protein K2N34_05415 [Lachnospiraceae bacterium]|nr:hypothetical protein [Lachnospiraceae bacterium]